MKLGMLWCDDDKTRTLVEKVERAAIYYTNKYGVEPNCCHVALGTLNGHNALNGITLVESQRIRREHFWIGVENEKK
jgi:hypothetical protein